MKWTRKKINVDLSDKAMEFIENQARRNGYTFQEQLQDIFFTELQREMNEAKGFHIIPMG